MIYSAKYLENTIKEYPDGIYLNDLISILKEDINQNDLFIVASILKYSHNIHLEYEKNLGRVITKYFYTEK